MAVYFILYLMVVGFVWPVAYWMIRLFKYAVINIQDGGFNKWFTITVWTTMAAPFILFGLITLYATLGKVVVYGGALIVGALALWVGSKVKEE